MGRGTRAAFLLEQNDCLGGTAKRGEKKRRWRRWSWLHRGLDGVEHSGMTARYALSIQQEILVTY